MFHQLTSLKHDERMADIAQSQKPLKYIDSTVRATLGSDTYSTRQFYEPGDINVRPTPTNLNYFKDVNTVIQGRGALKTRGIFKTESGIESDLRPSNSTLNYNTRVHVYDRFDPSGAYNQETAFQAAVSSLPRFGVNTREEVRM